MFSLAVALASLVLVVAALLAIPVSKHVAALVTMRTAESFL